MAGMTRSGGGIEAEPNVIPMIDVLLVLLVIFMLNVRYHPFIPVQVPPPTAGAPTGQPQIVLELGVDGSSAINGQPVPDGELEAALRAIYDGRPSKLLFVKAAPGRTYQEVITAMDRARGAGVEVIGIVPRANGILVARRD